MRTVDLLSDTDYREQACKQLDAVLRDSSGFPVKRAQLYGLRQIARQQPGKVKEFAGHQRKRAEQKFKDASEGHKPKLQPELDFWKLVGDLCDSSSDWSVSKMGLENAPPELLEENIPPKRKGMPSAQRSKRNELKQRQKKWLEQWTKEHIPAFFERFCTHALYREATAKTNARPTGHSRGGRF